MEIKFPMETLYNIFKKNKKVNYWQCNGKPSIGMGGGGGFFKHTETHTHTHANIQTIHSPGTPTWIPNTGSNCNSNQSFSLKILWPIEFFLLSFSLLSKYFYL